MGWLWGRKKADPASEARSGEFDCEGVPQSAADFLARLGWDGLAPAVTGASVTLDRALQVPAFGSAVNFLSGTMSALPMGVFQVGEGGAKSAVQNDVSALLHDAVNDETSSFDWRKGFFDSVFTVGRGLTYIERTTGDKVVNLWPFDPKATKVIRKDGRKFYEVRDGRTKTYEAREVIDVPFMLKPDLLGHRGPLSMGRDAIAVAMAARAYGAKIFNKGGLPPAVITGGFQTGAAAVRASDDVLRAMEQAHADGRPWLAIPTGHELKSIAFNAEQLQLLEAQRFYVEEIARLFSLPPVFLQDLTHGTFSNTEQQDLHFVKHTLHRWVKQFEQELTLKLFGRAPKAKVEMNLDGLLRGDIKTRMEAHAQAIQHGIYSPAHAARIEDHPVRPEADKILVQGAMVPIGTQTNPKGDSNGA